MKPDIRQWRTIDESWLSAALAAGGIEAELKGFEASPVGTGQIGDCVRFELDYSNRPARCARIARRQVPVGIGREPQDGHLTGQLPP